LISSALRRNIGISGPARDPRGGSCRETSRRQKLTQSTSIGTGWLAALATATLAFSGAVAAQDFEGEFADGEYVELSAPGTLAKVRKKPLTYDELAADVAALLP